MCLAFTLFGYWLAGLNNNSSATFYFIFMLFSALYVSDAFVMTIAALIPWYLIGTAVASAGYGLFVLLSGYFTLKKNLPAGWEVGCWLIHIVRFIAVG